MSGATKRLLQTYSGGGGRPSDFLKFEDKQTKALRFYRFNMIVDGKQIKEVCTSRRVHFHGPGKPPTDCPGTGCERCSKAAMSEALGTEEGKKRANDLRATENSEFSVIDIADPTRFQIWGAGWGAVQRILLKIAEVGGWLSGYPEGLMADNASEEEKAEKTAELEAFDAAFNKGLDRVCGPNGRDFVVTYNKKAGPKTWTVVVRTDDNKVLPFLEDDTVFSPVVLRERIANGNKESD